MRVISRRTLKEFWERHADAEQPLQAWFGEAEDASWKQPQDIKNDFASVSFVADKVVFNVGGNKYRLVVFIVYPSFTVYILWIGTHAEYDKIDVEEI